MTKVWKRTGAVAVYSPVRVAALGLLVLIAVAAGGFAGGLAVGDDDVAAPPTAAVPSIPDSTEADPASSETGTASRRESRASRRRGFRAGYRAGLRRGLARAVTGLEPNAAYVVTVGDSARSVARRYKLRPGELYRLCGDGNALCIRSGAP